MFLKNKMYQLYLRLRHKAFRHIPMSVHICKDLVIGERNTLGNCSIGNGVRVGNGVTLGDYSAVQQTSIDDNTQIERGVVCTGYGTGRIKIGKECYIGIYNVLDYSDNITIGDHVHIAGPSTGLWTHSSVNMCLNGDALKDKTPENRPTAPVIIKNNVYIGGQCTIYPGVTIGHYSVVAPNSVVTRDVEPFSMVAGAPAKEIKKIDGTEKTD